MKKTTFLEQALVKGNPEINAFTVNRKLINSKKYRDKFENLPLDKRLVNRVYKEVGRLLNHVDGQECEYLVALDYRTGERIVDNFERDGNPDGTSFNEPEAGRIQGRVLILIHNHSYNGRPTYQDMLTFLKNDKIKLSIVVCHDGDLYAICNVNQNLPTVYGRIVEMLRSKGVYGALNKEMALMELYDKNDSFGSKEKTFDIRRY